MFKKKQQKQKGSQALAGLKKAMPEPDFDEAGGAHIIYDKTTKDSGKKGHTNKHIEIHNANSAADAGNAFSKVNT